MMEQDQIHLQQEQILWAVIDERELGQDVYQHLQKCPVCKAKIEQYNAELLEFGRKALEAVPPSRRTVRLPCKRPAAISHDAGWLSFFGAAAMAGFVVFFYIMGIYSTMPPGQLITTQSEMLEDESLMQEISEMVENPLFNDMYEITGENGTGFDDDFLQFVVPDTLDDFQSEIYKQGGVWRC